MSAEEIIRLAAVLAAVVTIAGCVYKIGMFLRKLARFVNRTDEAIPRLLDVADNWSYNGGYTLRDKLERTESNVAAIGAHLGLDIEPVKKPDPDTP